MRKQLKVLKAQFYLKIALNIILVATIHETLSEYIIQIVPNISIVCMRF